MSQKFCNILVDASLWCIYHMTKTVQAVIGSIMVVSIVTHALLHCVCDLKAAQMNLQCSLMHELMLYKFKMGQEATKNICCMKSEGAV